MFALIGFAFLQATPLIGDKSPITWECPQGRARSVCEATGNAVSAEGALLSIRSEVSPRVPLASMIARVPVVRWHGHVIRVSADIRTTGSTLGASLWLQAEVPARALDTTVAPRDVDANAGWQHVEMTYLVVPETDFVRIGFTLTGSGSGFARNVRIEPIVTPLDGKAVPRVLPALAAARDALPTDSSTADDAVETLRTIEHAFFHVWFAAGAADASRTLQRSWRTETPMDTIDVVSRSQSVRGLPRNFLHCHPDSPTSPRANEYVLRWLQLLIYSGVGDHAICPSWMLSKTNGRLGDERLNADTAIAPALRATVRAERAAVIAALNRAVARFPSNNWLVGQRVRFLVDQRDTLGAVSAVNRCAADAWWCGLLAGYVLNWQGKAADADAVFETVVPNAPAEVRCAMTDLQALFPRGRDLVYLAFPCARRDSINAKIWWLSDPLWTEPGNERRAAHHARHVEVMLRSAVEENVPYDWDSRFGGDAVYEMFVRYGAPSAHQWSDDLEDSNHRRYLRSVRPVNFTTNEYTLDRLHTVPLWPAFENPLKAAARDWQLTATAYGHDPTEGELWWPREHFARDRGRLVQLFDHQVAMFRRDDDVLLAVAVDPFSTDSTLPRGATTGAMILTTAPDSLSIRRLEQGVGGAMQLRTTIRSTPQLLGLELHLGQGGSASARTRFGITPPAPLSRFAGSAPAMSDIALVMPGTSELRPDVITTLPRMFGTTHLGDAPRLGVYWETYGIAPDDSISVAIRVERTDRPGALRRFARAIGLVGRTESNIAIGWQEARASNNAAVLPARVPTLARVIQLNISSLVSGSYRLSISITRPGSAPIVGTREFTI
jgi:hypothetical protein